MMLIAHILGELPLNPKPSTLGVSEKFVLMEPLAGGAV